MHNFLALAGVQGGNALVPLLIVPFALATIGPEAYAQVAVTEAVSTIVLAAVLFSFEVDGVARISALPDRRNPTQLSAILSEILSARIVMFTLSAPLVVLGYWLLGGRSVELLITWLLVPFGQIFHSYWFYQGIENNVPAAIVTLTCRLVTVAAALLWLNGPEDGAMLPLAIGGPFAVAGLVSTAYLVRSLGLRLRWAGFKVVIAALRQGKAIFAGNAAVTLYRDMNIVILGAVGAPAVSIATYALVEKWTKMLQAVTRPLNQLFFPKVLRAIAGAPHPTPGAARIIARFTLPQVAIVVGLLTVLVLTYIASRQIWTELARLDELQQVHLLAAIMAPATIMGMANFMFGTAGLNYLGERGYFFKAILITGSVNVVACYALSFALGSVGAAIAFVGSEALLLILVLTRYRLGTTVTRPVIDRSQSWK